MDNSALTIYFEDISHCSKITQEQEYELAERIEKGDEEALVELTEANLPLVLSVAKKYRGQGLTFDDLIQEGNIGLFLAAKKFDRTKGFKFCTYATWWIRHVITRALSNSSKTIRIPAHITELINKTRKVEQEMTNALGRTPSDAELAKSMGVEEKDIFEIHNYMNEMISLDAPIGDDENATVGVLIEDNKFLSPELASLNEDNKEVIEAVLETLEDREAEIIRYRFGLDGNTPKTLEEVGIILKLTKERVRQLEAKALRKLRDPRRASYLKEYLSN